LDDLAYSLRTLCEHNQDGAYMTRAQRKRGLLMIADELKALGYRLPNARAIKPKHVSALIASWRGRSVSDATLKNRMGWVRWWAMKSGKPGLFPRDNGELGIAEKTTFKVSAVATPLILRVRKDFRM
jgi:hypothetical protein